MLDSSSQLLLDNAAPKSSSENFSSNKSANSGDSGFANVFNDAGKQVQSKQSDNARDNEVKNSPTSVKHDKKPVKNTASSKPETSEKSSQTAKSEESGKTDVKKQATSAEAETQESAAGEEQELVVKQASKTNSFNPLLLIKTSDLEAAKVDSEKEMADEKGQVSLQSLVAKILHDRSNEPVGDEVAVENDALAKLNVSTNDTAAYVKAVVSDLRNTLEKQNSQTKQSLLSKDVLSKGEGDPMKHALNLEEEMSLDDSKVDEFVSKVLERLNMNKSNLEAIISAKAAASEKPQVATDFVDQLAAKLGTEGADRINTMGTSIGAINQRVNNLVPTQQFTMNTHINQPEWGSEFGKRIQFMMNNNIQTAELRLDPPELGKINIKINMSSDQANVSFTSPHQSVRDTIENTLPRLRELLAESGLNLGNTDVASHSQQQAKDEKQAEGNIFGPTLPDMDDDLLLETANAPKLHYSTDGMIDYFA